MAGNNRRQKLAVIIAYFLIYVVWGSTYFFIGEALESIPTFLLGALRFSFAGLILLGICLYRGKRVFDARIIFRSMFSGVILLFVDQTVIMLAQQYVTSSMVAIVASSTAVWILLLDFPMWKHSFRNPATVAGILLGFFGVGMLYFEQMTSEASLPGSHIGMLILIGGCISWAIGTIYTKYCSAEADESEGFVSSAWQMFSASIFFWSFSAFRGELTGFEVSSVSAGSWLSLIYLITFGSILAYTAYIWLLKVRPAAEVATHAYVNPIVAVLIGGILGGEHISLIQLAGLAVIIISVILVNGDFRRLKSDS